MPVPAFERNRKMRGTLKQRSKGSWTLILDLGYQVDPVTGTSKRKQKWMTIRGTRKEAERKLTKYVHDANHGEFVEPSDLTLGAWLIEWLAKTITPPLRAQGTYDSYKGIIETHIVPALGGTRVQALKPIDVEAYYAELVAKKLSAATIESHASILNNALKAAVRNNLVTRNVVSLAVGKPRRTAGQDVLDHTWTAGEARTFLDTAMADGPQMAAIFALALDSGARRGELGALRWTDLDLTTRMMTIRRNLLKHRPTPVFGNTKTKKIRQVELSPETVAVLITHKQQQAELKLRNRTAYVDHGLVFAKEHRCTPTDALGLPLDWGTLGQREFPRLAKAAGVKRIKFHGLRHTSATLLLAAGVPAHVVQRRLGHSKVTMTLDIYAHVLPDQSADAVARLARLLHG
jgi:integrase